MLDQIKSQLKALRMPVVLAHFDEFASKTKMENLEVLSDLLERELEQRKENSIQTRLKRSKIPNLTTLEEFDWNFNPLNRFDFESLKNQRFLDEKETAIFIGDHGTGKTHVANAIGLHFVLQGKTVFFCTGKKLALDILIGIETKSLSKVFAKILNADLWILDDFGITSYPPVVEPEIYDLFNQRLGVNALILTSNQKLKDWSKCFTDETLSKATIDRVLNKGKIFKFEGKSHRTSHLKNFEFESI